MRFLVDVDGAWAITVHSEETGRRWQRAMLKEHDGQGGVLPIPSPTTLRAGEQMATGLRNEPPEQIRALYERVVNSQMQPGEMVAYGSYLFHNLVGSVIWAAIKAEVEEKHAKFIELALCWNKDDANLSRLHWEMMNHDGRFLVLGLANGAAMIDVAITRIVPDATANAKSLGPTPRVLFVIGQPLTDASIRPGAEIMSLLQHSTLDHRLNPAFLENASPASIERKIEAFRPEIVHFICHGIIDALSNRGKLILQPDPPDTNKHFGGDQIAQWLRAAPVSPQIVVLSACDSGVASGAALGPQIVSPLAAELVSHGIPIVVGMSGRVSDLACRLFTRRFAAAMFSGETLVAAAAKGRRAAFAQGNAPDSPDWAFPTIYLSAKVDSQYAPACQNPGLDVEDRLTPYTLPREPVFCGRHDFFEGYRELLEDKRTNVLAACVVDEEKGYGRTRLLQQLTVRAVVDGNVPCPVLTNVHTWKVPKDELEVARWIDEATKLARRSLGLPTGEDTPVQLLQMYKNGNFSVNDLPRPIARDIMRTTVIKRDEIPNVMPSTIRVALELEFAELMKSAREKHPTLITPMSRAIVLLDDADEYLDLLLSITDEKTLGVCGFGESERVSFVMTFSGRKSARDVVDPNTPRVGWNMKELRPFSKAANKREDMLAYARVLMNPFDKGILKDTSDRAWFMDYGAPAESVSECERFYSDHLKGMPAEFSSRDFYFLALVAREKQFLLAAADDQALEILIEP